MDLDSFFRRITANVDRELDRLIAPNEYSPARLVEAMRWSTFAGGKRFRPALVFASGETFRAGETQLISTAAAVEMIHTYSLIHDDLPSMDNDDLRRGRQTCHKKFGDATAILAGDALQAKAFETIAGDLSNIAAIKIELLSGLGDAAARMVAGQQMDLESEGKGLSIENVKSIHANKTGALISFSVVAGALIGGATDDEQRSIREFGNALGLLFQITDDLLDVTGATAILGKTAGKDAASDKATYPNVIGIDETGRLAVDVADSARASLHRIDRDSEILNSMVTFLLERRS